MNEQELNEVAELCESYYTQSQQLGGTAIITAQAASHAIVGRVSALIAEMRAQVKRISELETDLSRVTRERDAYNSTSMKNAARAAKLEAALRIIAGSPWYDDRCRYCDQWKEEPHTDDCVWAEAQQLLKTE